MIRRIVASGLKPSRLHDVHRGAEALEQRRGARRSPAARGRRARVTACMHGLDPRVVRAAGDDHADLAPPVTSGKVGLLAACGRAASARAARRPTTSAMRAAGMPVPGRLVVSTLARASRPRRRARPHHALLERGAGRVERRVALLVAVCRSPPRPGARRPPGAPGPRGSSEAWWSGPYRRVESVKCFSTQPAPSATAAIEVWMSGVWSESPTGQPKRSPASSMARRFTFSGGQG